MLANTQGATRIGLRTRRGLKGAVVRNRLKRQLRTLVYARDFPFRAGLDVVIVVHPKTPSAKTAHLEIELLTLCKKIGALNK